MNQRKFAVIVAGGKGLRMKSEVPKQFMILKGIPVLMHTVNAFFYADESIEIILVLPKAHIELWSKLILEYDFKTPHNVVVGGDTRFQSVKNGIDSIIGEGVVAVHDGVRPMISTSLINNSFQVAAENGSAIATVALKDSIRKLERNHSVSVDRNIHRLVQTPQTFILNDLKEAYSVKEKPFFTDDASVFEASGKSVSLIDGEYKNIKITTPEDISLAEVFLAG